MPVPAQRDLEQARSQLAQWLAPRLGDGVEVSEITSPGLTGFSSETLLFDALLPDGSTRGLVAKVAPTGYRVFLDPQFEAQFRVLSALAAHSDAPVPSAHWYEDDTSVLGAPFYVMGMIQGRVPSDNPPGADSAVIPSWSSYTSFRVLTDGLSNTFLIGEKHVPNRKFGQHDNHLRDIQLNGQHHLHH